MSDLKDFVIESGVLKKYVGHGGDVVIPEGVVEIGCSAFELCDNVKSVIIANTVKDIGFSAFRYCSNLQTVVLPKNLATIKAYTFEGCKNLAEIIIPAEVTSIEEWAFIFCDELKQVVIKGRPVLGKEVFRDCKALSLLEIDANVNIPAKTFGDQLPAGLRQQCNDLYRNFSEGAIKQYIIPAQKKNNIWNILSEETKARLLLYKQGKSVNLEYGLNILPGEADAISERILNLLPANATAKECTAVINCINLLSGKARNETVYRLYNWVLGQKNGKKFLEKIENKQLFDAFGNNTKMLADEGKDEFEHIFDQEGLTISDLQAKLKNYYALTFAELPELIMSDGKKVDSSVFAFLLTAHEKISTDIFGSPCVDSNVKEPVVCQTAQYILSKLDMIVFNDALKRLSDNFLLGKKGKKMFLVYPICRYADHTLLKELLKKAKTWATAGSGNNAPALLAFRNAILYSNDPLVISFADEYGDLNAYSKIHKTNVSELQCDKKHILKKCKKELFDIFLKGTTIGATVWLDTYTKDPRVEIAKSIVWEQNGVTFIVKDGQFLSHNGDVYSFGNTSVKLAHPLEMSKIDLIAWQHFFTKNNIKQPFNQIWEPAILGDSVYNDRYARIAIPFYRFKGQEKHGIFIEDTDFHNNIDINFDGCEIVVERLDFKSHAIDMNHRFVIKKFHFTKYTRQVNHLVAYLDRCVGYEAVLKDDVSISNVLEDFTLGQICDFIKFANENNAINVLAVLIDYKNKNFADFDPMDEFVLE